MTYEGGLIEAWKNKKRQEDWGEQHCLYSPCSFDSLAHYLNMCLVCLQCLFTIAVVSWMRSDNYCVIKDIQVSKTFLAG